MTDLLSHEQSIIEQGKQRIDLQEEIEPSHYAELLKAYIKLNKEQNRLIRLSDKSQKKLSVANAKLANFSTKLSKYFSPEVYNSLFTGELDVKVQTQRKLLTIFFSDLEGFTELTERLEPEVLTELLTHYLTEMSKIALRWGGTIDKYIGDAIMIISIAILTQLTASDFSPLLAGSPKKIMIASPIYLSIVPPHRNAILDISVR